MFEGLAWENLAKKEAGPYLSGFSRDRDISLTRKSKGFFSKLGAEIAHSLNHGLYKGKEF